ncbi:hypothetical protein EJJ36_14180 [Acinetobacter junii]|jgi:hypothetical protein|uniref:hypothetical protein n=1 Tax=Acinetobacter junii TaxID=40215 RepID=UPI000F7E1F77|nr:hypothetical protein [Acinetobacter junii]RTE44911.1 hypothetical protein EJJ36_14180 [Acinetobacter junii]
MTDVTNALIALKDLLQSLYASLNEEKKQHLILLKELNTYLKNSQDIVEHNIEEFLNKIEFSNLIQATNQAQANIEKQEQAIAFLSKSIEKLGNLVDASIIKIGEQHDKMISDIEENSDVVREKIIKTISADFKKDVISSFIFELEESIHQTTQSIRNSNNNALQNIKATYIELNKEVKTVKENHIISLHDFQNHVGLFNKNMNEAIKSIATAFADVEQKCISFTENLFESNANFLDEIIIKIKSQTIEINSKLDEEIIEIIKSFKNQITENSKYFNNEVKNLNASISKSCTNTISLMQSTTKEIQAESTKLLEAQNEHAKNIISASQKIIEAQELACKKMHEKMNFKFYTSNSILLLIVCLIVLIGLNFAATYRYNQMRSTTLALTNEAYHLKQENNRLYSIRNEFIKMTKGSRKELLQRFPGLVINCTIPEQ